MRWAVNQLASPRSAGVALAVAVHAIAATLLMAVWGRSYSAEHAILIDIVYELPSEIDLEKDNPEDTSTPPRINPNRQEDVLVETVPDEPPSFSEREDAAADQEPNVSQPEPVTPIEGTVIIERRNKAGLPNAERPSYQHNSPLGGAEHNALSAIMSHRLSEKQKLELGCNLNSQSKPRTWSQLPEDDSIRVNEMFNALLAKSDRKDSYFELMMDRNANIPSTLPGGPDGIDNKIFLDRLDRDPDVERIRNGQKPSWEDDLRRDLARN